MTLEQLRIFVAVAERLHVTQAARELNITQSAASAAIAALEARHGVRLLNRVARHIELTEAGRQFLDEARAILARVTAAEGVLADLSGLSRGRLSIHASQTIANYWLPALLDAFRRRHPAIAVGLAISNTHQVARAVLDGAADLGFVEGDVAEPALGRQALVGDELAVVVEASHPWAGAGPLDPARLVDSDWVLREPGSGTRGHFEKALRRFGLKSRQLRIVLELPSNEAVLAAVAAGAGATALSTLILGATPHGGALRRVDLPLGARPFYLLWHRERARSQAAQAFAALLPGGGAKRIAG
jgi:DNA-binding transcriptional LysR family regulator